MKPPLGRVPILRLLSPLGPVPVPLPRAITGRIGVPPGRRQSQRGLLLPAGMAGLPGLKAGLLPGLPGPQLRGRPAGRSCASAPFPRARYWPSEFPRPTYAGCSRCEALTRFFCAVFPDPDKQHARPQLYVGNPPFGGHLPSRPRSPPTDASHAGRIGGYGWRSNMASDPWSLALRRG